MMTRLILTCLFMLSASFARAEVVVFAAASLKEPLDRMAADFGDVTVSYGGSGTLARQVSLGAPADVVLLANVDWMDFLEAEAHVRAESVTDIASNALVLIGPEAMAEVPLTAEGLDAALAGGRIATGLTESVPSGIYARAALENLGLWGAMADRLAEVDNVRNALALVARGQAPLGIVYATDARVSDAVHIVARFPNDSHPPIRYLGAVTPDAEQEAQAFLDFVAGPEGRAALGDAGFLPPCGSAE